MTTPLISVVIVTYNSKAYIGACLETIEAHTRAAHEVVVVDNASSDGTVEYVAAAHPSVRLIARKRNGGLSAAVNDGVAASNGTYVTAINPDTRLTSDALSALAAYLGTHPDVGIVAPKLLDDDGTLQLSCRAFPGYSTAFFNRYSLLTRLMPGNRYARNYLMADFDHGSTKDVDWVSGAAMMFPRPVFEEVGGWDDGFFMFNEDVDFCRRIHDARSRVVYNPSVAVYHRIGVSKRAPASIVVERHKSMWRYYRKHMRSNALVDAATAVGIAGRCGFVLATSVIRSALARIRR